MVTDTANAVAPGATVTVTSTDRQTERQTKSNSQGYYRLTSLEPGNYQVSVQSPGFRVAMRTGFKLDVNQSLRLDFALEVGQVSERVEVVGEAQLLELNTAQLGTVVSEEKISDLPLDARNFTQLLTLTPGASPVSVAQNRAGGQTTPRIGVLVFPAINGQTNRSNTFTLDGVYNTAHFLSTYIVAPNIDGLNQFKVQSHSDQAEFGGVTGGVVNISSKSGTNDFHDRAVGYTTTTFTDAPVHTGRNFNGEGFFKGFPDDPRALVPGMSIPGYFTLNRILGPQPAIQARADLLHNFGSHSLKFGFEIVRQSWTNAQITETLDFNTRQTAT